MKTLSVDALRTLMTSQPITLIDVREEEEYEESSIAGAFLIPLGLISEDRLPTTQGPLIIHCRSGKRSLTACEKLLSENGTLDVYSLEGGILAWEKAGYPVQRGS